MKRGIIYGRVSTNKQSSESVETQIAECRKWADENNCIIVDIYDDSGQSGRSYNVGNRSGFQQIKADAKAGRMDYAIIHKIDRFARSVLNYFNQEAELAEYGVQIIVVSMPHLATADIITKSVHIAMAEQFSVNLSNEVSTKMRTFAKKGAFLGGRTPFGYDVVIKDGNKTFAVNPRQAETVKRIYDLYLQSYGYNKISNILKAEGHLNADGKQFNENHIRAILRNKVYIGYYVYGKHQIINGIETLIRDEKKIKERLIEIPDFYDKIIDEETFSAVQNKMAANVPRNKRRIRYYPFTGKMFCRECGRAVTGHSSRNNGKIYSYYRCLGTKLHGCKTPAIKADLLEDFIINQVKKHLFSAEFKAQLLRDVEKELYGDVEALKKTKKQLEAELKQIETEVKEATKDKYGSRIKEHVYNELMDEYEAREEAITKRLIDINANINVADKTAEIDNYISMLESSLDSSSQEVKTAFLNQIVNAIILSPGKAEVFINLSTPPFRGNFNSFRVSMLSVGTPILTIDTLPIYANNGAPLLLFNYMQ